MAMASRIRILLIERNMKMKDLAELLGYSGNNLSNKLKADNFSEKELTAIAKACDATFEGNLYLERYKEGDLTGMDMILNLLPLTEGERAAFLAAAPDYEHIFRPVDSSRTSAEPDEPGLIGRAAIIFGCPSTKALAEAKSLKWLQTWSAGVDPYLRPGVLPEGAILTSAIGAYGQAVSEHMLAMLLSLLKRLPQYRDAQARRDFAELGQVKSIRGATVLILGAGDIGSAFAALCKALGAGKTMGVRRDCAKPAKQIDALYPLTELDALLPLADVVAMALPRSAETENLMDERRLRLMKGDAVLLNAGRGTAVDCAALAEVLSSGHLWGVGLDVTEPEPLPPDHPLWAAPNALLTPHVAGGDHLDATRAAFVSIALENLRHYLEGESLRNRFR